MIGALLLSDFFKFSPERFTRPGVIAGIVVMAAGLTAVLAADAIGRALSAWTAKRRDLGALKRDDGTIKTEGGSEKDGAERDARKSVGAAGWAMITRLVGAAVLVAGAVAALMCAQ